MARRASAPETRVVPLSALGTGGGDKYLREAADIIARAARGFAGTWSRKIPASITVSVDADTATITASAPNARPAELRLEHPLFGNREHWYGPPGEKFLSPAVDSRSDAAAIKYSEKFDAYARKLGYK